MNYVESDYYIVPEKTEIIGEYQNPINPVIAEQYSAVVVYSIPVIGGLNVHRRNMPKFNSLFGSVFEPAFNKNSAFNRNFGTTLLTVAKGNHTHSGVYEPVISPKNNAFNKIFGTAADTVAEGNHIHSGVYEPVISPKNNAFNKSFGTAAGKVAEGNHTHSQYITAVWGEWVSLTLINGWNSDGMRYRISTDGKNVQLFGTLYPDSATNNNFSEVPVEIRPMLNELFYSIQRAGYTVYIEIGQSFLSASYSDGVYIVVNYIYPIS
jgi:hypothetical protein